MKLKQWLYGATALAMLAACSDKDFGPESGSGELNGDSEISGYLAVEIKLPQETVTRAEDEGAKNDRFDDGLPGEYEVNNAMIVVFKGGTDEKKATFEKAVNLEKPFFTNEPSTDNITSSYIAAIPVPKLKTDGTEHYYGLVILNRDTDNTDVAKGTEGTSTGVKIAGNALVKGTTTLANILDYITDIDFMKNGFFMTNAPLANKPVSATSSAGDIRYLADLGTKTYESIAEAKNNIVNCIYVERAVAKVTYGTTGAYNLKFVDKDGNSITGLTVTAKVKYALTNTNKKSYVVRNVESTKLGDHFNWALASVENNRFRMIGTTPMLGLKSPFHSTERDWYRTYWCHDPNYNKDVFTVAENGTNTTEMNLITEDDFKDVTEPLYCRENTFDVAHQNNGNSTMVVFQVDFTVTKPASEDGKNGESFTNLYIKDGDNSKIYVSEDDAAWEEISRIYNNGDVQKALTAALEASGVTPDENDIVKNAEKYLHIEKVVEDNLLIIKSISIEEGTGINAAGITAFNNYIGSADGSLVTGKDENGEDVKSQIQMNLLADVNFLSDITVYTGGVSYYSIPIKHFGDYYCPWNEVMGTVTKDVYNGGNEFGADDNHAKNYLGRYGMVRNNWYDLNISEISALGSPTIPEINLTLSDDNKEDKRYIGVEIHVLSWAKRTQNIKF